MCARKTIHYDIDGKAKHCTQLKNYRIIARKNKNSFVIYNQRYEAA